jgi:hypothetical protein
MNKILAGFLCVLGLAISCMPAYANPSNKKIALSCNVTSGTDIITGTVMVTLCDSALCDGATVPCDPIDCDSSGVSAPISITVACDSPTFRVAGFHEVMGATDYAVNPIAGGPGDVIGFGGSDVMTKLVGKGYSLSINTIPGSVSDAVAFTIK